MRIRRFLLHFYFALIMSLLLILSNSTYAQNDTLFVQPSVFYLVEEDSDFPPITPLGIIQDKFGNYHSWFFYIEPSDSQDEIFITVYYNIVFVNGSNFLQFLTRESVFNTKFFFLQKLDLVTTSDGSTFGVYIRSSDFGTSVMQFGWNPQDQFFQKWLQTPREVSFEGEILGPIRQNDKTSYYITANDGKRRLYEFLFEGTEFNDYIINDYPVVPPMNNNFERIFGIQRFGNSTYYLGSQSIAPDLSHLKLVRETNGTFYLLNTYAINVKPQLPQLRFFAGILVDIIVPQLEVTNNGSFYSFLFSLNEDMPIRKLIRWGIGKNIDVFANEETDPFLISFFPTIKAVNNTVRIASLGVQIAQDVFSITADLFSYNTETGILTREKIQETSFSFGFFLFAMDLSGDDPVGIACTFTTPDYILDQYNVKNSTVGTLFLFSAKEIVEVEPSTILVHIDNTASLVQEEEIGPNIVVVISLLSLLVTGISLYSWRRSQLKIPESIKYQVNKAREVPDPTVIEKFLGSIALHAVFLKTNRRRILISVFVLIIPILLIMSLFVGLLSHQDALLETYENKNPLNDDKNLKFDIGDFVWTRSIYDDELANYSISPAEWEIPRQLSKLQLERYDVDQTIDQLSVTTIFPLFDRRKITILNDEGQNETINYPVARNFAIIDPTWETYMQSQLVRGRLPETSNEIIVQESWYEERDPFNPDAPFGFLWDLGSEIKFYGSELDIFLNTTIPDLHQNLTVVGVVRKLENLQFKEIESWAHQLQTTVTSLRLLDSIPFYIFPEFVGPMLDRFSRLSIRPTAYVDVRYDVFSIERDDIPVIIDNYQRLSERVLQETGFNWLGNFTDNRIGPFLTNYYDASRDIQLESTVIIIPVLGLTLLLTYKGLGIGRSSIEEELERFRNEGIRFEQILTLTLLERLFNSAVATSIAYLLLFPTLSLLLKFTGFFELTPAYTPAVHNEFTPAITLAIFATMVLLGVFQTIQYYYSSRDWRHQQYLSSFQQDILLIIGSLIFFQIASAISSIFEDQISKNAEESINSTTELVVLAFRLISLLAMSFAAVVIASKLINRLFMFIGALIWRIYPSRLTLTANGISSNMSLYGRGILVFAISIFLIIPMIVVPATLEQKYINQAYNEMGTDIIANEWNTIDVDKQSEIHSIDGITSISSYFFGELAFENGVKIRTLAIDPGSFEDSIFLPSSYIKDYKINFKLLTELQDFDIITNKEFIERNPFNVGDNFTLGYTHINSTSTFVIKGTYRQFPILKFELTAVEDPELIPLQMVISLSTLEKIQQLYMVNATEISTSIVSELNLRNLAIKLTDITMEGQVADEIKELTGLKVDLLSDYIEDFYHPFFRIFEFISHISLVVAITGPMLASLIISNVLFERRKYELEMYRRNGISHTFFLAQLSGEFVLATVLPSLLAIQLGAWWTNNYGAELFGEISSELPWTTDIQLIYSLYAIVISFSLLIWVVRLFLLSKQHIKEVRI